MTFDEYQTFTKEVAFYPDAGHNIVYPALGLCGEAGEAIEHIKKAVRDDNGILSDARRMKLFYELGDVLYYLARLAEESQLSLDAIAAGNMAKLRKRKIEGKIHGEGSDR
jgi:NTP pyrophosphatase (non-canonical NTP hydrolase)